MTNTINFNNLTELVNDYGGSEKKKKFYDRNTNSVYMVKLPDPIREKNNMLSYMNNQFSEYVGSHIYSIIGIPVQDTVMGKYTDNKERIVVGCKDFTTNVNKLIEFGTYELSRNSDLVFVQSIERFMDTIENDPRFNISQAKKRFWDMFVVDALIMNSDRHFHNIGVLENIEKNTLELSPVFDCGSSLGALMSDGVIEQLMTDSSLFKNEVFNTHSAMSLNGKRILNHELLANPCNDLKLSILDIVPKVDIDAINNMIEDTPYLSNIRKEFYKEVIKFNKTNMLDKAYKKIVNKSISNDIDKMIKGTYNYHKEDDSDKGNCL